MEKVNGSPQPEEAARPEGDVDCLPRNDEGCSCSCVGSDSASVGGPHHDEGCGNYAPRKRRDPSPPDSGEAARPVDLDAISREGWGNAGKFLPNGIDAVHSRPAFNHGFATAANALVPEVERLRFALARRTDAPKLDRETLYQIIHKWTYDNVGPPEAADQAGPLTDTILAALSEGKTT